MRTNSGLWSCVYAILVFQTTHGAIDIGLGTLEDLDLQHAEDITITYNTGRYSRSVRDSPLLHTSFSSSSGDVTLKFRQTSKEVPRIPVYFGNGEEITPAFIEQSFFQCLSVYEDRDNMATAFIDHCNLENSAPFMMAELAINGSQHMLLPVNNGDCDGGCQHKLVKVREPEIPFCYQDKVSVSRTDDKQTDIVKSRRQKRQATLYTIELMFAIDFSIYSFWYDQSSGNASERAQEATNRITQIYTFAATAINARFQNIDINDLNIQVELVYLYIATTASGSPWTPASGLASVETALASFTTWINSQTGLPNYDHAQTITRNNLLQGSTDVAGYASFEGMCTENSVSIVEDHFNFIFITIATHEIGHSIGGNHDGEAGNSCNSADGFILATFNQAMTGSAKRNPWLFSPCSIASFKAYINSYTDGTRNYANCLLTKDVTTTIPFTGDMPGQTFSVDEQCTLNLDSTSYMCRHMYNGSYAGICNKLWCSTSATLSQCKDILPADGTPCGKKKWCKNGECISDDAAPRAQLVTPATEEAYKASCIFGDYPGPVVGNMTCADVVASGAYNCYAELVLNTCCQSCNDVRENITGCEFGNRDTCSILSSSCYTQSIADGCCKTCAGFADDTLPANCLYGDHLLDCKISACGTENGRANCCKTCYLASLTTASTTGSGQTTAAGTASTSAATTQSTASTASTAASGTTDPFGILSGEKQTSSNVPDWVIPVAVAGACLLLVILVTAWMCYCKSDKSRPRYRRRQPTAPPLSSGNGRRHKPDKRDRTPRGRPDRQPDRQYDSYYPHDNQYDNRNFDNQYDRGLGLDPHQSKMSVFGDNGNANMYGYSPKKDRLIDRKWYDYFY